MYQTNELSITKLIGITTFTTELNTTKVERNLTVLQFIIENHLNL